MVVFLCFNVSSTTEKHGRFVLFVTRNSRKHDQDEFEDTKGVIRMRKSKDTQHNGQKKKDKRTNNDIQNIHIKLKIQ